MNAEPRESVRRTRISLKPSELDEDKAHTRCEVKEAWISVQREGTPDDKEVLYGERDQNLFLSMDELQYLYHRMRVYFEQGIWSGGTVEWDE